MSLTSDLAIVWPFVTIVVPALNEERDIGECLAGLLRQDYQGKFEVLVMDAESTDRTREIAADIQARDPRVRVVANPRRLQSAACNHAALLAKKESSVLLRADAHCGYASSFVATCVRELLVRTATSVVVPMVATGFCRIQAAIAALQNSWIGNGGSAHRRGSISGFVEHGHHAAFDLAFFRQVGGYDETFSHNEDAELDHRMTAVGGRVWMAGNCPITYLPRSNLRSLAKQYFNHGRGRARMLLTHRLHPRPRQIAPLLFLAGTLAGLLLSPVSLLFLALPVSYFLVCTIVGLAVLRAAELPLLMIVGLMVMIIHLGWAVGFVAGSAKFIFAEGGGLHVKPQISTALSQNIVDDYA